MDEGVLHDLPQTLCVVCPDTVHQHPDRCNLVGTFNDPESAIRRMVRANAEKDLPTLSRLMAHDADIISYAVAGRKYIGWTELEKGMREEFATSQKLEIPIHELTVWRKGDLAWYAMELDYIRYVAEDLN